MNYGDKWCVITHFITHCNFKKTHASRKNKQIKKASSLMTTKHNTLQQCNCVIIYANLIAQYILFSNCFPQENQQVSVRKQSVLSINYFGTYPEPPVVLHFCSSSPFCFWDVESYISRKPQVLVCLSFLREINQHLMGIPTLTVSLLLPHELPATASAQIHFSLRTDFVYIHITCVWQCFNLQVVTHLLLMLLTSV